MKKRLVSLLLCLCIALSVLPLNAFAASEQEATPLQILQQPTNLTVDIGETVSTRVVAAGDDLCYQWYVCNPGTNWYVKSSITTDTYTYEMVPEKAGRKVYCVITDRYGNKVTTNTVTFYAESVRITKQPENVTVKIGELVSTTVIAEGGGLPYQWYVCNPGTKQYVKSSITTDTYTYEMVPEKDGRKVYCVVTDSYGNKVTSKTVTFYSDTPLLILQQPTDVKAAVGATISTSVTVQGNGLKYQWYFREPGSSTVGKSSVTSRTYSCEMTRAKSGRQIYCVITDRTGNTVTSDTVTLEVPPLPKLLQQPEDVYVYVGQVATTNVVVEGEGLKYQWYIQNPGMSGFAKSSIQTDTYTYEMTVEKAGRKAYCVITDQFGETLTSQTVTFTTPYAKFEKTQYNIKPNQTVALKITLKPDTFADTFTYVSSNPAVVTVSDEGIVTGLKNGTATVTATGKLTGLVATCKVKVGNAKQIAITFDDGPGSHTKRLLDFLKQEEIRVTFFVVCNRLSGQKEMIRREVAEGHEIGYHSYDHNNQTNLSSSQIIKDYEKSSKLLKDIAGGEFTVWRTPGGNYNQRVLDCVKLPHILWSVDTLDWKYRDADRVYRQIKGGAKDGAIILLHDIHSTTVTGAIRALRELKAEGYEFVTVTELLSRNGTAPKASTTYRKG